MFLNVYMDDVRNPPENHDQLWIPVRRAEDVIYLLRNNMVKDLSLDHDMGTDPVTGGYSMSGYELLQLMEAQNLWPRGQIFLHSANPVGIQRMRAILNSNGR